jgi:hypothetical protein
LTKGELDVFAVIPRDARLVPDTTLDHSKEPIAEIPRIRVHAAGAVIDIVHYPRACDASVYRWRKPDEQAYSVLPSETRRQHSYSVLASETRHDGYWVKLEQKITFQGETRVFLVIETCSASLKTVCNAELSREDEAGAAAVTAICKSITAVEPRT